MEYNRLQTLIVYNQINLQDTSRPKGPQRELKYSHKFNHNSQTALHIDTAVMTQVIHIVTPSEEIQSYLKVIPSLDDVDWLYDGESDPHATYRFSKARALSHQINDSLQVNKEVNLAFLEKRAKVFVNQLVNWQRRGVIDVQQRDAIISDTVCQFAALMQQELVNQNASYGVPLIVQAAQPDTTVNINAYSDLTHIGSGGVVVVGGVKSASKINSKPPSTKLIRRAPPGTYCNTTSNTTSSIVNSGGGGDVNNVMSMMIEPKNNSNQLPNHTLLSKADCDSLRAQTNSTGGGGGGGGGGLKRARTEPTFTNIMNTSSNTTSSLRSSQNMTSGVVSFPPQHVLTGSIKTSIQMPLFIPHTNNNNQDKQNRFITKDVNLLMSNMHTSTIPTITSTMQNNSYQQQSSMDVKSLTPNDAILGLMALVRGPSVNDLSDITTENHNFTSSIPRTD